MWLIASLINSTCYSSEPSLRYSDIAADSHDKQNLGTFGACCGAVAGVIFDSEEAACQVLCAVVDAAVIAAPIFPIYC